MTPVNVVDFLPLVRNAARRYRPCSDPVFDDLVQAGCLGLVRAAKRYDPSRGTFGNFAAWFVMHEQTRLLERQRRPRMKPLDDRDTLEGDEKLGLHERLPDPRAVNAEEMLSSETAAVRELAARHRNPRVRVLVEGMIANDGNSVTAARLAGVSYSRGRCLLREMGGRYSPSAYVAKAAQQWRRDVAGLRDE